MAFMTAGEAHREAGSPQRAAKLAKEHGELGLIALERKDFATASVELQKASAFAGALACIVGAYDRHAKLLGKPPHTQKNS